MGSSSLLANSTSHGGLPSLADWHPQVPSCRYLSPAGCQYQLVHQTFHLHHPGNHPHLIDLFSVFLHPFTYWVPTPAWASWDAARIQQDRLWTLWSLYLRDNRPLQGLLREDGNRLLSPEILCVRVVNSPFPTAGK